MSIAPSIGLKDGELLMTRFCTLAWPYKITVRHSTGKIFLYNVSIRLSLSRRFLRMFLIFSQELITNFKRFSSRISRRSNLLYSLSNITTVFPLSAFCMRITFCLVKFLKSLASPVLRFDLILRLSILA